MGIQTFSSVSSPARTPFGFTVAALERSQHTLSVMVREGLVWDHVRIVTEREKGDPEVQCSLCSWKGTAGSTRLRSHFRCQTGQRVAKCMFPKEAMIQWHKEIAAESGSA